MSEVNKTTSVPQNGLLEGTTAPSLGTYAKNYVRRMRSGDMGSLPIILGIIVIAIIFQSQNQHYLTPRNFVNLIVQMAGITTIAMGVVFVLLLGEIDLSVGYVSAVSAVFLAMRLRPPTGWPWTLAIIAALLFAAAIGIIQGAFITKARLPSFIVTLAGLLVWNGVVLILIGTGGTVIIQHPVVIGIANYFLSPTVGWLVGIATILFFAINHLRRWRMRQHRSVTSEPFLIVVLQIVVAVALILAVVYVANQDRGVPFVGVLLLILLVAFSYIANRTRFGRYVYAIGGNEESARRAGIQVDRIKILVFMISSLMAGMGGIVLASRLRSVDTAAGGGNLLLMSIAAPVIGGTSLFGGYGRVMSALLGALVIASIENGMGLLGLSAGAKFIITGLVLLFAVLIDAITRRGREQFGIS
ncbi:MAG: ABC transporter permease [Chloroflexi bacterium]|nr:ABC transporter permease [Chloroflexota bacterium]